MKGKILASSWVWAFGLSTVTHAHGGLCRLPRVTWITESGAEQWVKIFGTHTRFGLQIPNSVIFNDPLNELPVRSDEFSMSDSWKSVRPSRRREERTHEFGKQFAFIREILVSHQWPLSPLWKRLLELPYWPKFVELLCSEMAKVLENLDSVMEKTTHPNHAFSQWEATLQMTKVLLMYQVWHLGQLF